MTTAPKLTRAEASRLNGAKSRGPITEEGKRRAAQNALKHGLSAETHLVLKHEDAAAYRALLDRLVAHHRPNDPDRVHLVERLASVMWRQRRLDRLEAAIFNQSTYSMGPEVRLGVDVPSYEALQRSQVRLDRQLFQLLKALRETQAEDEDVLDAPANDDAAPLQNEPCLVRVWHEVGGAHPVHGVGARGRRSERTQGPSPWLSVIPPRIQGSPNG